MVSAGEQDRNGSHGVGHAAGHEADIGVRLPGAKGAFHLAAHHEGELVGWVQEAKGRAAGIIVNAAGYTTTSIALLDALLALGLPVIEVHLSNIFRRESFRQHSLISLAAKGVICGLGASGYLLAIDAFARLLRTEEEA